MLFSFLYQEYHLPTQEIATYSDSYVVFILVLGISGSHTRDSNIFRQLCCFHSCIRNITYPHKRQQHIQTAMLFSFLYQEYQVATQEIFQAAMLFSFLYQEYQVATQEIATYSDSYVVFILVLGIRYPHKRQQHIQVAYSCNRNIRYPHKRQQHTILFSFLNRNITYPHKRQQHIQTAMLFSFLYQEYQVSTQEIATYSDSYIVFILVLGISGSHTRDSNIFRQLCCFHSCNRNIRYPHKRQQHIQTAMLFSFL